MQNNNVYSNTVSISYRIPWKIREKSFVLVKVQLTSNVPNIYKPSQWFTIKKSWKYTSGEVPFLLELEVFERQLEAPLKKDLERLLIW